MITLYWYCIALQCKDPILSVEMLYFCVLFK